MCGIFLVLLAITGRTIFFRLFWLPAMLGSTTLKTDYADVVGQEFQHVTYGLQQFVSF